MSEENEPLIKHHLKTTSPSYGTKEIHFTRLVPQEDRITYTWSDLNAFAMEKISTKNRFLNLLNKNIDVEVKRKHILSNVSGTAYPGELLAILGSSGAGKTTLLNALTFRSPSNVTITGIRCVNGNPVTSGSLTSQSAYVQQDDLFIGSLTVKEHLIFQALVRMDKDIPYGRRMERVEEVISELALIKCQNTRIGIPGIQQGISGGELKRLSFAAEVLTNPPLMFCDEPTSGLDSFMALNVVQLLKNMAQTGKTIICTIHQPSSELYSMFDKLLLMAEGRVAFLGTTEEADIFFKDLEAPCPYNYNPADYYIQLLAVVPGQEESSKNAINMICDNFSKSEYGVRVSVESSTTNQDISYDFWLDGDHQRSPYRASWCAQFRAVLWRSWLSIMKEPLIIKVRLLQTIAVSLIISALYYGQELTEDGAMNINGVLFIFLTNMTFQNIFAVVNVFCSELSVFLRENKNGMYRTDVYFLCKTLADFPIFTILPIVFICICYFIVGLNQDIYRFLISTGIIVLVSHVTVGFGYAISCASGDLSIALSVGPPFIIPFLLFGGFFLNVSSIPGGILWLSYFSWFRYGYETLLINQWTGIETIECLNANNTCPASGEVILETYHFSQMNFTWDIIYLILLLCFFRIVAFLALLARTIF